MSAERSLTLCVEVTLTCRHAADLDRLEEEARVHVESELSGLLFDGDEVTDGQFEFGDPWWNEGPSIVDPEARFLITDEGRRALDGANGLRV